MLVPPILCFLKQHKQSLNHLPSTREFVPKLLSWSDLHLLDCIDCWCDVFFRIFHREDNNKLITFVTWLRPVLLIGKFLPLGDKKNLEWSYKGFLWKHCAEEVTFQRNFLIWNFHIYTIVSSNVGCQNIAKFG